DGDSGRYHQSGKPLDAIGLLRYVPMEHRGADSGVLPLRWQFRWYKRHLRREPGHQNRQNADWRADGWAHALGPPLVAKRIELAVQRLYVQGQWRCESAP